MSESVARLVGEHAAHPVLPCRGIDEANVISPLPHPAFAGPGLPVKDEPGNRASVLKGLLESILTVEARSLLQSLLVDLKPRSCCTFAGDNIGIPSGFHFHSCPCHPVRRVANAVNIKAVPAVVQTQTSPLEAEIPQNPAGHALRAFSLQLIQARLFPGRRVCYPIGLFVFRVSRPLRLQRSCGCRGPVTGQQARGFRGADLIGQGTNYVTVPVTFKRSQSGAYPLGRPLQALNELLALLTLLFEKLALLLDV